MDKDMLYECITCKQQEVVLASDKRKDGRSCQLCGRHTTAIGFADERIVNANPKLLRDKCEHKWIDMEDGTLDKFCVRCSKKAKQAVIEPITIPNVVPNVQPAMEDIFKALSVPKKLLNNDGFNPGICMFDETIEIKNK
jgi:DNA-directed RNA polymerase subunit RPC12/RpoP